MKVKTRADLDDYLYVINCIRIFKGLKKIPSNILPYKKIDEQALTGLKNSIEMSDASSDTKKFLNIIKTAGATLALTKESYAHFIGVSTRYISKFILSNDVNISNKEDSLFYNEIARVRVLAKIKLAIRLREESVVYV